MDLNDLPPLSDPMARLAVYRIARRAEEHDVGGMDAEWERARTEQAERKPPRERSDEDWLWLHFGRQG